jgi:predicted permease
MSESSIAPPRLASRLLSATLGDDDFADSVVGDLAEEWRERTGSGARFNRVWYWREAIAISARFTLAERFGGRRRSQMIRSAAVRVRLRGYANDARRGFHAAIRQRALLASAAIAIALGIASPTTIFSIVHGLSRDLPVRDAARIVYITQSNQTTGALDIGLTRPVAIALTREQRSLEGIAAFVDGPVTLGTDNGSAAHYTGARISPNAFSLLGVKPIWGTDFSEANAERGADIAMISDALWKSRFGASRDVLGRVVRLNRRSVRIVGVMPAGFQFPLKDDVWQPLALSDAGSRTDSLVKAFGKLRRDVGVSKATAELAAIGARVVRDPLEPGQRVVTRVIPYRESQLEPSDLLLFRAMLLVVSMVLLVACANVANLFLASVAARGPLFAVKTALGAGRGAIVREILAQTGVAAILGGAAGVLIAAGAVAWFNDSVSDALPAFWMSVTIDPGALAYSGVLVLVATFAAGLAPALNAARANPASALREQGRSLASRGSRRWMRALLVVEVAVSCALLLVAGVMAKGVVRGAETRFGVDASRITKANIYMDALADDAARGAFISHVTTPGADPHLARVAFTTSLPGRAGSSTRFSVGGKGYDRGTAFPETRLAIVSPSVFGLFGVRPLRGRLLDATDDSARPRVAVVNETFVKTHFPGAAEGDVVGIRVALREDADTVPLTIVGVVPDYSTDNANPTSVELLMLPFAQHVVGSGALLASGGAASPSAVEALQGVVRQASSDAAMDGFASLSEALARARRTSWSLAAVFAQCGLAGLILAAIGVYGVAATASRRRVHEVAIRRALGAPAWNTATLVFSESAIPIAIGMILGGALAFVVTPSLALLLFGENPHDASIFALVTGGLTAVMIVAGGRPAYQVATAPLTESLRGA